MRPAALVAVAFSCPGTGLARVSTNVLEALAGDFDVHWIGLGSEGAVSSRNDLTLHPANPEGGDPYGAYQAKALVEDLGARLVWLYNDPWMLKNYAPALAGLRPRPAIVTHTLLDGALVDDDLVAALPASDRLVVCSEFARRELTRSLERLRREGRAVPARTVDVVPYGVDTTVFRPLPGDLEEHFGSRGRGAAKRAAFPDRPHLWDSFLVLNGNRPQPRKRLDLTLEAFARFARGKPPGVRLFLHSAAATPREREELRDAAGRLGLGDRLETFEGESLHLDGRRLNLLYNACEVGINTSMGEGWGLVSLEHAATGGAQVVPGHSACREIWQGAAEMLTARPAARPELSPLSLAEVSADEAAAALERLYRDPRHRRQVSLAGYRRATDPALSWESVTRSWRELCRRALDEATGRRRSAPRTDPPA